MAEVIDEDRMKKAFDRYFDVQSMIVEKEKKKNNFIQLRMFLIGIACVAIAAFVSNLSFI